MKKFSLNLDPRLKSQLSAQKHSLTLGLICSLIGSGLSTLVDVLCAKYSIQAIRTRDLELLGQISFSVILLYGIKYWFTRGQSYFLNKAESQLTSQLRLDLFTKLQKLPIGYFQKKRSGGLQSILTNDLNVYTSAISVIKTAIDGPIKVILGFGTIAIIQWELAIAALLVMPLMIIVIRKNSRQMRSIQREVQERLEDMNSVMQESLQGIRVIKSFGSEDRVVKRFKKLTDRSLSSLLKSAHKIAILRPTLELIGAFGLSLAIYFCGHLAFAGQLTVDNLAAFLTGLNTINQATKNLGSIHQTIAQIQGAIDRIYENIFDVPDEAASKPSTRYIEAPSGRIEFKNVSFTYPDGTVALQNVSFVLEPKTSIALIGPSGAGKSTIVDLILRFYDPTEGVITFDGVDIKELDYRWLRKQMSVVPQQTFLFSGTIADNLLFSVPKKQKAITQEQDMRTALRFANAETFVDELPSGLNTEIGERHAGLSGGQAQRIAIARALMRNPKLLILDEATSNLDPVSEQAVQNAVENIIETKTCFFIAHKLTTASRAHQILVLRKGQIIEKGSHETLMEKEGIYKSMYDAYTSGMIHGL